MASGHSLSPSYLLSAHPAVYLLTVTVEEMQVQALLILLLTLRPQLLQSFPVVGKCCHLCKGRGKRPGRY